MKEDTPIRKQLRTALAALESEDWPWAVAELRAQEYRVTPEEMVADPRAALIVARAAWVAPWECLAELQVLFWDGEDRAYLQMDAERVPTAVAEQLFVAALHRLGRAASDEAWDEMLRYAELLLELPGASDKREQVLLDLFAGLIDRANVAAKEISEQEKRPLHGVEQERFAAIWSVIGLAAQSSAYDIATSLLLGLLRGGERPILHACDAAMVLLLWPDLLAIWKLRQKQNLPEPAKEWLHRMVCQDEPGEHAAPEREEP